MVTPSGVRAASVHIVGGRITRVGDWSEVAPGDEIVDAGDWIVMPGVIDMHVHPVMGGIKALYECNFAFTASPDEIADMSNAPAGESRMLFSSFAITIN